MHFHQHREPAYVTINVTHFFAQSIENDNNKKFESVLTIQGIFHLFCHEEPMFFKNRDVLGGYRDARTRTL